MTVSRSKKSEILESLKENFKNAQSIGFTTNNTLTVDEITKVRHNILDIDAKYMLAKKTLIKIAAKDVLNIEIKSEDLPGQVGVIFSNSDPIEGLSKANSVIKELGDEKIEWIASIFEGEFKGKEETKAIAGLPTKETLLGRLVGSLMSPLSSLARFLDAAKTELEEKGAETLAKLPTETKEEDKKVEEKVEETKEEVKKEETTEEK